MANCVDEQADLGQYCLPRSLCLSTYFFKVYSLKIVASQNGHHYYRIYPPIRRGFALLE